MITFLGKKLKVRNRQISFVKLGLINHQPNSYFNKACLNVLRTEDIKQVGARLNIK